MYTGLSTLQAEELLKLHGPNSIRSTTTKSFFYRLKAQLKNILVGLLCIASILSFISQEYVDGFLIIGIVVMNTIFGLYQEKKANEALRSLNVINTSFVRVKRDNREQQIENTKIVPGDIVFIEEGTKIPGDGKLVEIYNLEINESVLTGESLAITKGVNDEVFMGTIVSRGRGYMLIEKTGMETKFGQIAKEILQDTDKKTPLQIKIDKLSKFIGIVSIFLAITLFFIAMLHHIDSLSAFLLSISLAIAIVPESLPAIVTITLGMGVRDLVKKKVIMRQLAAIETLGNVNLIATDKTGTITMNQMKVKEIFLNNNILTSLTDRDNVAFLDLLTNSILCSTASLVYVEESKDYDILGDPTEGSLLYLAQKVGLDYAQMRKQWKLIKEIPFNKETKIMSVEAQKDGNTIVFSKGALEPVLSQCKYVLEDGRNILLNERRIEQIYEASNKWGEHGLRVVAFSMNNDPKDPDTHTFMGMAGIYDPPRPEVKDAIVKAYKAGIEVVMITGDNIKTASSIAFTVGILKEHDEVLTGDQVENYSDEELLKIIPKVRVFAQTTPLHKARIVKLFQQSGKVVAVTGDGVNDAIALKNADVGIAMGRAGTDVARETADMVITDDNFATIITAIEEGRHIVRNIKHAVTYLLATNIGEALVISVSLLMGLPILLFPIQVLYINFIGDGIPALAFAFSPHNPKSMEQAPKKRLSILLKKDYLFILIMSVITCILVLTSFHFFNKQSLEIGRTAAFAVLVLIQPFILVIIFLSYRPILANLYHLKSRIILLSIFVPILTLIFIMNTHAVAHEFRVVSVTAINFLYFVLISSTILIGRYIFVTFRRHRIFE